MSERARPNPLRTSRSFRRLWLARTISHVGDGIALVALVLLVQETEGTGTAVGVLLLASSLPRFLGPLAGVVADRVEQRTLMVLCDVGNAAIFATIAWSRPSFGVLLALVAALRGPRHALRARRQERGSGAGAQRRPPPRRTPGWEPR